MNNSKEHEDINADKTLDKSVEQANITPAKDESALSDLLHVLGIKKKTSAAQNLHHASHTPTIVPVSTVLLDKLVTQVPPNLAVLDRSSPGPRRARPRRRRRGWPGRGSSPAAAGRGAG